MEICGLNLDLIVMHIFKNLLRLAKKRLTLPKRQEYLFKSPHRDQHYQLILFNDPSWRQISAYLINSLLVSI